MDNDFQRAQARANQQNSARPLRPLQPAPMRPGQPAARSLDPMRPSPAQPYGNRPTMPGARPSVTHTQPVGQPQPMAHHASPHSTHQPNPQLSPNNVTPQPQNHHNPQPTQHPAQTPQHTFAPPAKRSNKKKRKVVFILLGLIGIGLLAAVVYFYGTLAMQLSKKDDQLTQLQTQYNDLREDNRDLTKKLTDATQGTDGMSQADRDTITAAVTSNKYQPIEQFLQESTLVVYAASDGSGRHTPEQVMDDLKSLDKALQPWNFSLPAETIANYRDGDYAQYFPEGAIIGKSADNKVVSFSTTPGGKVSVVFIASNESLL